MGFEWDVYHLLTGAGFRNHPEVHSEWHEPTKNLALSTLAASCGVEKTGWIKKTFAVILHKSSGRFLGYSQNDASPLYR